LGAYARVRAAAIFEKRQRKQQGGIQSQVAVFGINGPISVAPSNFVWFREATTSTGSTTSTSSVLDGAVSRG
jgi:hypothetical protein